MEMMMIGAFGSTAPRPRHAATASGNAKRMKMRRNMEIDSLSFRRAPPVSVPVADRARRERGGAAAHSSVARRKMAGGGGRGAVRARARGAGERVGAGADAARAARAHAGHSAQPRHGVDDQRRGAARR